MSKIKYGEYIGFLHYLSSQALVSQYPRYLTETFYSEYNKFSKEPCQPSPGRHFLTTLIEYCDLRLKELQVEADSSKEILTKEFLERGPLLLKNPLEVFDEDADEYAVWHNFPLPKLDIELSPFESSKIAFYYYLFGNLISRFVNSFFNSLSGMEREAKVNNTWVIKSLESEIVSTKFQVKRVRFNPLNEFELLTTQKRSNDYIFRSLGFLLTSTHYELILYFEIEGIPVQTANVLNKIGSFVSPKSLVVLNCRANILGRIVMRYVSKRADSSTLLKLIDKIKAQYLSLTGSTKYLEEEGMIKKKYLGLIVIIENLIFLKENNSFLTNYPSFKELKSAQFTKRACDDYLDKLKRELECISDVLVRKRKLTDETGKVQFINTNLEIKGYYLESIPRRIIAVLPSFDHLPLKVRIRKFGTLKKRKSLNNFGFNGDSLEKEKLKIVIARLCNELYLLNEDLTSQIDLLQLLTSDNYSTGKSIYLNCYTKVFAHLINIFTDYCPNFKAREIGKSQLFYSKENPQKHITAQNIYSSKAGKRPSSFATIEKICKELRKKD